MQGASVAELMASLKALGLPGVGEGSGEGAGAEY